MRKDLLNRTVKLPKGAFGDETLHLQSTQSSWTYGRNRTGRRHVASEFE